MNLPNISEDPAVLTMITMALAEDLDEAGDVTTGALVTDSSEISAVIISKCSCVVSGTRVAEAVFQSIDPGLDCEVCIADGSLIENGDAVMKICGNSSAILTAERTALNFMQRMCGIATLTREFVELVKDKGVSILDTRKTTPGLRVFEKYAVLCGGGTNHRMGLFDMAMIKDNHRRLWKDGAGKGLDAAVEKVREESPGTPVEVEVESEEELESALKALPEWILLDNMSPDKMKRCVEICDGRCKLEASGGITLENIEAAAASGVDAISLGCLTHSAPSADLSLELVD